MVDETTIGPWLRSLKDGDADAMQVVWERFFHELVSYANRKLVSMPGLKGTGEDIAASVFESLWRGCQEGRFQHVNSHSELWWTLLMMARRKCASHVRRETAAKRGGQETIVPLQQQDQNEQEFFLTLVSNGDNPEYLAIIAEETQRCLAMIRDEKQRQIAALSLEGDSPPEIAEKLDLSESTVRRKLKIVLATWKADRDEDQG